MVAVRIIALETTERIGTVAALEGDNLLIDLRLCQNQRSAESLAPGMLKLIQKVDWRPTDVDLVAVTIGPGSFTGLRVGLTTAKTFAYCVQAEILGVDTLEAIAAGVPDDVKALSVAVDAQRGEVVAGSLRRNKDGWFAFSEAPRLVDVDTWLSDLSPNTVVAGPILRKISNRIPDDVRMLEPRYWSASAAAVGRLAARQYAAGKRHSVCELVPRYSRRSAAEEKWEKKHRTCE